MLNLIVPKTVTIQLQQNKNRNIYKHIQDCLVNIFFKYYAQLFFCTQFIEKNITDRLILSFNSEAHR